MTPPPSPPVPAAPVPAGASAPPDRSTPPAEQPAGSGPTVGSGSTGASGAASTAPAPRRRRDPFFDNAKFIAMLLVVIGHVFSPMMGREPAAKVLYIFIYMFHMPVFIIVTGYFSRGFSLSSGKARKLITNLAVPYLVFEVAYAVVRKLLGGDLEFSLLTPYWLTWFLLATFFWRLSTPVWQQLRWPIPAAIVISLLSGTTNLPDELALHRTLGLLPFFVIGLLLEPRHFEWLHRRYVRIAGVIVLAGGLAGVALLHREFSFKWTYWAFSNDKMGVDELTGTFMRLGLFGASLLLSAAFLAVVPHRWTWYTMLGGATLYAYLLHGFPIRVAIAEGWYRPDFVGTPAGVAVLAVIAVLLAVVLMSAPVRRLTHWAMAPEMSWAFTRAGVYTGPGPRRARPKDTVAAGAGAGGRIEGEKR